MSENTSSQNFKTAVLFSDETKRAFHLSKILRTFHMSLERRLYNASPDSIPKVDVIYFDLFTYDGFLNKKFKKILDNNIEIYKIGLLYEVNEQIEKLILGKGIHKILYTHSLSRDLAKMIHATKEKTSDEPN